MTRATEPRILLQKLQIAAVESRPVFAGPW